MQEGLASLLARLFATGVTLKAPLASFHRDFAARVTELASQSEDAASTLQQLGLIVFEPS
jgi:hypothetical protein